MGYLSQVDYSATATITNWIGETVFNWWDEQKVKDLIPSFPSVFEKAKIDWTKFIAGIETGLFSENEKKKILDWFIQFPDMWETIRPNFITTEQGKQFGDQVDNFIGNILRSSVYKNRSLGIAPAVVAGVLIVGGIAASLWAIQYVQEQNNISNLIDGVVAGKIPPEILQEAIEKTNSGGWFDDIQGLIQIGIIGIVAWYLLPLVLKKK